MDVLSKKNSANLIPEYSVVYPEISSDSASDKSNGILLPSAKADIKKMIKLNWPNKG